MKRIRNYFIPSTGINFWCTGAISAGCLSSRQQRPTSWTRTHVRRVKVPCLNHSCSLYAMFFRAILITLRAKLSGAASVLLSVLSVTLVFATGGREVWICHHDNSKLRASIFTKPGLWVKVATVSS